MDACTLQPCNSLHPVCSVSLLTTELEIEDFLKKEDNCCKLLRAVIVSGTSGDTFTDFWPVGGVARLAGVPEPVDYTEAIVLPRFDGISLPKSVTFIFLATISITLPRMQFHFLNQKHYFSNT